MQIVADPSERAKLKTNWKPDTYLPLSQAIEYLLLNSMLICRIYKQCLVFSANADLEYILSKQNNILTGLFVSNRKFHTRAILALSALSNLTWMNPCLVLLSESLS